MNAFYAVTDAVIARVAQMNVDDDNSQPASSKASQSTAKGKKAKEGGRAVSCPLFPLFDSISPLGF